MRWLLPVYRQTKTGVVVPFLARLAGLMGQQAAPGVVVARPPLMQQVFLWAVWFCTVLALARPHSKEVEVVTGGQMSDEQL